MTPLFISNFPHRCIIAPSNFCSTRNFYTIPVMPRSKSHLLTKIFLFQCTGIFISNHKTKNKTKLIKTKQKPKQIKKNTSIFSLLTDSPLRTESSHKCTQTLDLNGLPHHVLSRFTRLYHI